MNTSRRDTSVLYLCVSLLMLSFTTLAYSQEIPDNILNNGDFDEQLNGWHHWTDANAGALALFATEGRKADPIAGNNAAYIKINEPGTALPHIQFYQQPFTLEKGTTYTYSMWAKSEAPRNITFRIMHQGAPWTVYAPKSISLTEEWQEFYNTFEMPVDDANSRAGIIMGTQTIDVWIDHVRLYEGEYVSDIEGTEPHSVEPAAKITTTWAALKNRN